MLAEGGREGGGAASCILRPITCGPELSYTSHRRRPLLEQRIRERQELRARGQLPPIDSPHRKPQHREGLTIPEGSLQRAI